MNEQRLLFPASASVIQRTRVVEPGCHRDDPRTSHDAAERLRQSGRLTGQHRAVLDAIRQCDGATHAELGEAMGVRWLAPARRLPELDRAGLVHRGEPRTCKVKGSRCTTWWILKGAD